MSTVMLLSKAGAIMVFLTKRKLGRLSGSICVAVGGTVAAESILHGIRANDWRSWFFGGLVGGLIVWLSHRSMTNPVNIRGRETVPRSQGDSHA